MKGLSSKILIALGIILIFLSILWWAIAVNALVKIPDDLDVTNYYEGTMTFFVDPLTRAPAPDGVEYGLKIKQEITSDKEEFDSSRGVIDETLTIEIEGLPAIESDFAYVLDRRNSKNLADDRAFAWDPGNVVDREGSYYPVFPFDTSKDGKYSFWKAEVGKAFEVEFKSEEEKEGLTVYNFGFKFEKEKVGDDYLATLGFLGLKKEMTLADLKPTLKAMGVDLDALQAQLSQAITDPADLQALGEALNAPMEATYYWDAEMEFSVEPRTGTPVDIYKDVEALSMELDTKGLTEKLTPVLGKYLADPVLGPVIQQVSAKMGEIGGAQKIFQYDFTSTADTIKQGADDAKKGANAISVVKVYIPWALLIVGALILIIGLLIGGGKAPEPEEEAGGEESK